MTSSGPAQRRSRHRYAYAEYLAYERDSGLEHEFEDGEIYAMAGVSRRHNDRGNKWQHYQLIASLSEYVLVSQSHARIECYRRLETGAWEHRDVTTGSVQLQCGATLELASLYADLPV